MTLKEQIYKYLQTQRLMTIATYGEEPWIANVYYLVDEDLNLYFMSKNFRQHCQDIKENPNVACAIADSSQPIYKPQKGIQLNGKTKVVNTFEKIKWAAKLWNKLIAQGKGEKIDPKKFVEAAVSSIYKVAPTKIKFFNTELWPKEQFQVLQLTR